LNRNIENPVLFRERMSWICLRYEDEIMQGKAKISDVIALRKERTMKKNCFFAQILRFTTRRIIMNNFTPGIRLFAGRFSPIIFVVTLLIGFTLHSMADDTFSGSCLTFDGRTGYVETELDDLSGSEITVEYWFRGSGLNSVVRQDKIPDHIVSGNGGAHVLSNDGGPEPANGIAFGSGATDGNWHHLAMTWKQNTTNGFKSYLDGVLVAQRDSSNMPIPNIENNLLFGSYLGTHAFMVGRLDEVRIWNIARTQTQIRENMYVTLDGTENGLVGYWPFDEGTGTTVEDVAGGNDGTLHGGVYWVPPSGGATAAGDLLQGEVLHMQFNEGSGGTVIDWAEQGNDGTIVGNARWVDGRYNGALYLDNKAYVTVPNAEPLTRLSNLTVALWVKFASLPEHPQWIISMLDMDSETIHGLALLMLTHSGRGFIVWEHSNTDVQVDLAAGFLQWNHVAVTWDGQSVTIYLNGDPVVRNSDDDWEPINVSDTSWVPSFDIGWGQRAYGQHFAGSIDDLWIFNDAKTGDEIRQIMHKPPNPVFVNAVGSNGKINVAVDSRDVFTVFYPGATPAGYHWRKVAGGDVPRTFEKGTTSERNFTFDQPGAWDIYCKVIDSSGNVSEAAKIPVYAWNRPEVRDAPPQSAIQDGTVSWYDGKYVGIVDESVKLMSQSDLKGNEAIAKYIWDFDNNWDTIELEQVEGQIAEYTWNAPNLSGTIYCKAVTNYGIESEKKQFDLKIYNVMEVNPGGPYTARPNEVVQLGGTINKESYPGYRSIEYQWSIRDGETLIPIDTDSDGYAEYAWSPTGNESDTYHVELTATVVTAEDVRVTGNASASVTVESGKPTAMPGGPYRGGIAGGSFSPIPFEGNHPDFVEADDIGTIVDWQWFFGNPNSGQSGLVGEFYQYPTDKDNLEDIEDYIQNNNVTPEVVMRFETVDFPTTNGDFQHSNNESTGLKDWFFARFTGFVEIQEPGDYNFHVNTDDGFRLQIDGKTIVESPGGIGGQSVIHHFDKADSYSIELVFFEQDGDAGLMLSWTPPGEQEAVIPAERLDSGGFTRGIWNPTPAYARAGTYPVRLRVQSEFGKWSTAVTTKVQVIDGKITGHVQASDLRTPVKDARLTLTSSHVDPDVLAQIAHLDESLSTTGDGGIQVATDEKGYYAFEHIPLGSYRIAAGLVGEDEDPHEFETAIIATELTLDAPNQLAVDFVDINVFPISGRIVYSIQKNEEDVLVDDVVVEAQAVGTTNSLKSLPSTKSGDITGNYSLPLFSGKYLFLANREGRDIRIKPDTTDYDSNTGLVTIDRARTDIDFIDHTTRELTVFVEDSGEYSMPGREIIVSGNNGQAEGVSDDADGKFVVTLNPGKYTVTVPGGMPKGEDVEKAAEVDLTGGDTVVTMVIPVKIALHIVSEKPKLLNVTDEKYLEQCGLELEHNPEGYMYYYPPEPQTHIYIIEATANGNPVEDFTLFVTNEISMTTEDPPEEQETPVQGTQGEYEVKVGIPKLDRNLDPPLAAPKSIRFRAEKASYKASDHIEDEVIVLGDVSVGTAAKIISIPTINHLILHDPPGDGSYSYLEDSMTTKGYVWGMEFFPDTYQMHVQGVPVYPSPWSHERTSIDLEDNAVVDARVPVWTAGAGFVPAAAIETATGALAVATGPIAWGIQLIKSAVFVAAREFGAAVPVGMVQYEISPNRRLQTPAGDDLSDLVGPGKGDIYYGEGWTVGLQTKYRLCVKLRTDDQGEPILDDQDKEIWDLETHQIETYAPLDRTNQYVYTVRDIENIIRDLEASIDLADTEGERTAATNAKTTWVDLLNQNLAYKWNRYYIGNADKIATLKQKGEGLTATEQTELIKLEEVKTAIDQAGGDIFAALKNTEELSDEFETLIFSAGPEFEYSRRIQQGVTNSFSLEVAFESGAEMSHEFDVKTGFEAWGSGTTITIKSGGSGAINTSTSYSSAWESGIESEQSVGFVLQDDDIGDNIATRVYTDPVWGTPLFFQEPGSITSDPWEPGTNKAVDVVMELIEEPSSVGPFDYHDGTHYRVKVQYTGARELEAATVDFVIYANPILNLEEMTAQFNGQHGPFELYLCKQAPTLEVEVSLYPPAIDQNNTEEKEYEIGIEVDSITDAPQIFRVLTLKPKFADLRAPRAIITAPYSGQRISPVLFPETDPFDIQLVSNDLDLDNIQLQIRSKQPDSVWEPWRNLSGMAWEDGGANANVEVFERLERNPPRREFTFKWTEGEIKTLGVGEYALRAVATDKATKPNVDIEPPDVVFLVDGSKPTVLTTIPDYQAPESQRIYRGELSAIFTDDMRADDFSDRTFAVADLLKGGEQVAGFASYSPTLRKSVFVPVVPFQPNGFYRVEIKTDVHDFAGNPLDNAFMWTFRTTDSPFEETWSIILSADDGTSTDANNIVAVEYGAEDGEDEKDARAVPKISSQFDLSFLDRDLVKFDRDIRPADGRLGHHWFFAISNPGGDVTIMYQPSIKLTRSPDLRQYKVLRLMEFDEDGNVSNIIPLKPEDAEFDPNTGKYMPLEAYSYTPKPGEDSRHFRLDVQKASFVATEFVKGTSGWKFLSVPITPDRADPFVNLGDDIESFKLYKYDTAISGYKIYPLDIGEVALQTGRGYFTRLEEYVEVDVGGSANSEDKEIVLADIGWHAIGNPFVEAVNVADLQINGQTFDQAAELIEGTLYRWNVAPDASDAYEAVEISGQLLPWEGYWLKTKSAELTLTIPTPEALPDYPTLPPSYNPPMAPEFRIRDGEFDLLLALTSDFSADLITALGTRPNARASFDSKDQSEPPTLDSTVSAYFDHRDWETEPGLYNTDYQPPLEIGESRTWKLVVYTNKPKAKMRLSWEDTIEQVSDDTINQEDCAAAMLPEPVQP